MTQKLLSVVAKHGLNMLEQKANFTTRKLRTISWKLVFSMVRCPSVGTTNRFYKIK